MLIREALVTLRSKDEGGDSPLSSEALTDNPAIVDSFSQSSSNAVEGVASQPSVSDEVELSATMFEDIGAGAVHKKASEVRRRRAAQTDEVLIERIACEKSQEAYSELYDRYAPRIYSLLLHIIRNEEDAQDLLQDVFAQVWQRAPQFLEQRGSVGPWILSIARHRGIDELRSRRFRDKLMENELIIGEDRPEIDEVMIDNRTPEVGLHAADARREVQLALTELSSDQRSIIDMAYFGGLTHVEIAQRLEMPVGTVKTKLRQAILSMGKRLKPLF